MTRRWTAWLLLPMLGGCAVSTGWRQLQAPASLEADKALPVSLIHTTVSDTHRTPFAKHTRLVMQTLPTQPGLVAYALKRELLGPNAWVIAVWASEEHRDRFVKGAAHQSAIANAAPGLTTLRIRRVALKPAELPLDWARAQVLLTQGDSP
jgi:quinol monooxygenase YgiN